MRVLTGTLCGLLLVGRDNQVYREEPRAEAFSRVLTFRCK